MPKFPMALPMFYGTGRVRLRHVVTPMLIAATALAFVRHGRQGALISSGSVSNTGLAVVGSTWMLLK